MATRTSTNYTGRIVDLSIFRFQSAELQGPITLSFGSPQKIITGIEKLKQIYAILFLTATGSVLFDRERGTFFGEQVGRTNINPAEVQHIVNIANVETRDIIIEDQLDTERTIPEDEYLVESSVLSVGVDPSDPSGMFTTISLEVASGEITELFIPIALPIT